MRRNASSFPCTPTCLSLPMARIGSGRIDRQLSVAAYEVGGEAWTAHFTFANLKHGYLPSMRSERK